MEKDIPYLHLFLTKHTLICHHCESNQLIVSGSKTQTIKHVLSNDSYSVIVFHKRVFKCANCGKYYVETLPNLISTKGISVFLEYAIINSLRNLTETYKDIGKKYHVSAQFVSDTFDRLVDIKSHKLPTVLSIDEVYARKLTSTKYCCVLFDPINKMLIDLIDSRRKETLIPYFARKNKDELKNVKYFICDLNETYRHLAYKFFYDVTVVADSFHVIKNIGEAFRVIRVSVMKEHENNRDISMEYWLFKKYFWMLNMNIDDIKKDYFNFKKWKMVLSKYQLIEYMLKVDETLKEAYELKEDYRDFNRYNKLNPGEDNTQIKEDLERLIDRFIRAKSAEMRKIGYMLFNWKNEIINSFIYINGFRLSNSIIERYNGEIKLSMANSYGFTNFQRARNRIMFSINKLESFSLIKRKKTNKRHKK